MLQWWCYGEYNVWYKEYKTSLGNAFATHRMTLTFLLISAVIADIWLDQVKFSVIITSKNLGKEFAQLLFLLQNFLFGF